ncbi:MAG TPA: hypothetical protein VMY42_03025 [Thermoguttaceae bacterium]|nr:hypothetical protein [Thermoguttaceae bacterium]
MGSLRFDQLLEFLTGKDLLVGLLWAGLAALTITLVVLMHTRWGQTRPLLKCVILSLGAHALFVAYTTTVILAFDPAEGKEDQEEVMQVSFVEALSESSADNPDSTAEGKPWERLIHDEVLRPEVIDPRREEPDPSAQPQREYRPRLASLPWEPRPDYPDSAEPPLPEPELPELERPQEDRLPQGPEPDGIDVPSYQPRESPELPTPDRPAPELPPLLIGSRPDLARSSPPPNPYVPGELDVPSTPRVSNAANVPQPEFTLPGRQEWMPSRPAEPAGLPPDNSDGQDPPDAPDVGTKIALAGQGLQQKTEQQVPNIYRLRTAPDRTSVAERLGATRESEEAVKAALNWLATIQKPDGRWDASEHGAGREQFVAERNRQGAGIEADTGVTGLALLAFLASGHTHREGPYRENVRLALQYLVRVQASDGNLAGNATVYARMYCHSMAAFALSEAYGMTNDQRLYPSVRRAVNYTIAAQDPSGGGWRYNPGDPGDTSQCGWQLMALKSAELAGIPIPVQTRNGLIRYLRKAASGTHGGKSSYRPGERVSRAMTAEALVCWQFLGMPREHPAGNEAGDFLLGELPDQGTANLYYWYYGTLGMYQLQGAYWQPWNEALQKTLVQSQRKTGTVAGSWDPDTVWGPYGGRIYSTALATLCLEVYYRFLPLYVSAAPADGSAQ